MATEEQRLSCLHEVLFFGSGAYYLICRSCEQMWVAVKPGADNEPEYGQGPRPMSGQERVKRK